MVDNYDDYTAEETYSYQNDNPIESSVSFENTIPDTSIVQFNLDYGNINSAESFLKHYSGTLEIEDVNQSIQSASDFFNMETPLIVTPGWRTGVFNKDFTTVKDDVLIFNTDELQNMGITEKDGLDLVMTHENAHRALQGLNTGFSDHQEELCCDYMAGVRAGMNGMDTHQMIISLKDTTESLSHPAGPLRISAIQEGELFAENFLKEHGHAPSFDDCLEHFKQSESFLSTPDSLAVVYNPDYNGDFHGYTQDEINRKMSHAQSEQSRYESLVRHNLEMAKHGLSDANTEYHEKQADIFQKRANECKAEYKKWKYTKPDEK